MLQTVTRDYVYDAANRVSSYSETGKSQAYAYDNFGNLWQSGAANGVPELRANGSAWFLQTDGTVTNRLKDTGYDAAGNQTQLSVTPGGTTAAYDAEGRLAQVKVGSAVVVTYDYDAEGRRVRRTDGSGTASYYVYDDQGRLMAEYGGAVGTSTGTRYLVRDHLGSTRMVQDEQGNCVTRIDYTPYGAVVPRSGQDCYSSPPASGLMFTAAMRDGDTAAGSATGLDHKGAREYWASLGRFTSPDPGNTGADAGVPGSWNMYSYAYNNPFYYIDPPGLGPCPADSETGEEKPCLERLWYERVYREWLDSLRRLEGAANEELNETKYTGATTQVTSASATGLGQLHHAISKAIQNALQRHPTLRNLYSARDPRFVTRAKDLLSHRGYQLWHRDYDSTVARWINENSNATKEEFEKFLKTLYRTSGELVSRFPSGIDVAAFVFLVPGQKEALNYERCGQGNCKEVY